MAARATKNGDCWYSARCPSSSVHCGRKFSVSSGWRRWSKSRFSAPKLFKLPYKHLKKKNSLTQSLSLYTDWGKKTFLSLPYTNPSLQTTTNTKFFFVSVLCSQKKGDLTRQTTLSIVEEFSISNSACVCLCLCTTNVRVSECKIMASSTEIRWLVSPFFCVV